MADTTEQTRSRRDNLRRFLEENALNEAGREMTPAAMELLEPLFRNAESGQYPLAEGSDELAGEALATLRSVFGEDRVERVILVSRARSLPKPGWKTLPAYGASPEANLGDSIRDSLEGSIWGSLEGSIWGNHGSGLWITLFCYLGSVLDGDRERVERLTPLVRLLPRALPLGEKEDEPGVWIVLVA